MIPNMDEIFNLAKKEQKSKVWLEFACAIRSNSKAIEYSAEQLAKRADEMVVEYNKRFVNNEN